MARSPTMSELDKLHAEVLQNPAADTPRIAYADAAAKTDPDRAELIRVQLQLLEWHHRALCCLETAGIEPTPGGAKPSTESRPYLATARNDSESLSRRVPCRPVLSHPVPQAPATYVQHGAGRNRAGVNRPVMLPRWLLPPKSSGSRADPSCAAACARSALPNYARSTGPSWRRQTRGFAGPNWAASTVAAGSTGSRCRGMLA